jgi:GT2 family glycosyltransferase
MSDINKPMTEKSGRSDVLPESVPDVSVVIVSWNVADLLADCLDSLMRTSQGLKLEVWVVDNASSDGSAEMVRTRYPWVRLIANEDNRGFARANNQAIRQATGRYVFILNPDTIVREGAIQTMARFLDEHLDAGAVGPRHVNADGVIGVAAARRLRNLSIVFWVEVMHIHGLPRIGPSLFRRLVNPYDFALTQEVESISGAAMIVRRELLQKLQGFGEIYRHCGEDIDLCYRIRAAAWKIYYCAEATIVHLIGRSSKQTPLRTVVNTLLSDGEYFFRCYGKVPGWIYRFMIQGLYAPKIVVMGLLKFVLRKETCRELKWRLELAWCLLAWREPVSK